MKRVISIHLAGKIFQIEEDAHDYLKNALDNQFGRDELERQIAERFENKLNAQALLPNKNRLITYFDVLETLNQLGINVNHTQQTKRLYRIGNNKMIAGVCTGLGEYFNIDPVVFRMIFVVGLVTATLGFWAYIFAWIIIPKK